MNLILDLFFPKKCVGCKKIDTYFCKGCIANILQTDLVCPQCERLAMGGQTHPICKRRFGLDGLWSLGIYQGSLKEAIKQFKYGKVTGLAEILVNIILEYWARYQPFVFDQIKISRGEGWAVVPVPLYWWRGNTRGFNQSSLIGQLLSKRLGLDYSEALKRTRYTKPQYQLEGPARHQNIRGAFEISSDFFLNPFPFTLLIDDVWTTGSTLKECCYILKRNGAKKVWAITLAR